MKSYCLIGLPHSGKTLFGNFLSLSKNKKFFDSDILLKRKFNKNLNDILKSKGTNDYLKEETSIIENINTNNILLSTSGSIIYSNKAMNHIKKNLNCEIIHLKLSFPEFIRRIDDYNKRGIVNPNNLSLNNLYYERISLYNNYQDISFNADNKTTLLEKLFIYIH